MDALFPLHSYMVGVIVYISSYIQMHTQQCLWIRLSEGKLSIHPSIHYLYIIQIYTPVLMCLHETQLVRMHDSSVSIGEVCE